jgi:antirestriction protein ArdC
MRREQGLLPQDTDHIQLPDRELFKDAPGFYGTATHELMHWTGARKRLNRESLTKSRASVPRTTTMRAMSCLPKYGA